MEDKNFDELAAKFARKIYQDKKGQIRLHILWRDLKEYCPELWQESSLNILDAGGGIGQVSAEVAKLGHKVVHSDPSIKMIELAKAHSEGLGVDPELITYRHENIQSHPIESLQQYDIVFFHAVLEWLADPLTVLENMITNLKPGAALSLMFYNRHSVVLTNLFKGNLRKVRSGNMGGYKNSLTPINPIEPESVYELLAKHHYTVEVLSGVRVFNDYMPRAVRGERSLEDTLELETALSRQPPYNAIARYIHLIARAPL